MLDGGRNSNANIAEAAGEDACAPLIQKSDGLYSGHFKALAAADVLAHGHIVTTNHIRLRLGELGAVALVGTARQLALLGAHQP